MIYDADKIAILISLYKCGQTEVADEILQESQSLVEVIVSRYNPVDREDMIQECLIKVLKAVSYYNPDVASAHKYFTTVITNACNDYANTARREEEIERELEIEYILHGSKSTSTSYTLQADQIMQLLVERNRRRFPSYDPNLIDQASKHIFFCIVEGTFGKSRGAITELTQMFPSLSRSQAITLYHSSLAYYRYLYRHEIEVFGGHYPADEDTLLPDIQEILGSKAYQMLLSIFSGMYIKIP